MGQYCALTLSVTRTRSQEAKTASVHLDKAIIQHDRFGGGLLMVWTGRNIHGATHRPLARQ